MVLVALGLLKLFGLQGKLMDAATGQEWSEVVTRRR